MGYTVRADQTLMRPAQTVYVEGDRVVRLATTEPAPAPAPSGGIGSGDDADLWVVAGPPPVTPPPGLESGDAWIDVASGDVFVYDPE
jgi:imidazolonepropionase-like amidohydrolase